MIRDINDNKPLWVRIVFESPEFLHELLLLGNFQTYRKKAIDLSTKIMLYCAKHSESPSKMIKYINTKNLLFLEWINNNWRKKVQDKK